MPLDTTPAPISRHFDPRRKPRSLTPTLDRRKRPPTMPRRAKELVELMAFGAPDGSAGPMDLDQAARHMGIAVGTAANYLRHPLARQHYMQQMQVLRDGTRARNLQRAKEIRDQSENLTAAVAALKWLEPADEARNLNINVGVQVSAGYVIDLTEPGDGRQLHRLTTDGAKPLIEHEDVGNGGGQRDD